MGGPRRLPGCLHVMRYQRIDPRKIGSALLLVPGRDGAVQLPALPVKHKLVSNIARDAVTKRIAVQFVDVVRPQHARAVMRRQMAVHDRLLGFCRRVDIDDKSGRKAQSRSACDFQCDLTFQVEAVDAACHSGVDRIR